MINILTKIFSNFGKLEKPSSLRALRKLAMQVLSVPASSAPERIVSTGGVIVRPHRSRLSSVNLEMLVALKCNHSLIV